MGIAFENHYYRTHPSMKLSTAGGKTLETQNLDSALLFMSCFYYYIAELINIFHHTW